MAEIEPVVEPSKEPKPSKFKLEPKTIWILAGIVILLIIFGVTVFVFRKSGNGTSGGVLQQLPEALDKLVASPSPQAPTTFSGLSGMPCDHANRRPISVMLAGDPINRPLSGFAQADMVWELPVLVSDVTRLMAVYQCGEPKEIGSVRSVRHDYLFLADGVDAIVGHWGGSYHALNRIAAGEFQTINALVNPFNTFYRKNNLPAPYNGFTSYDKLWNALQQLGYRTTSNFTGYQFKDDAAASERPAGGTLSIAWPGQFAVSWQYDPATNRYVRYWAGVKQTDPGDGNAVVAPSAVVIMRATNGPMTGPGGYNDVGIEGKGEMAVYQDGKVITGTWTKNELEKKDPVHFLDANGQPIVSTRGQIWVMTPASDIPVTWTAK